jgi:hypothetical protein
MKTSRTGAQPDRAGAKDRDRRETHGYDKDDKADCMRNKKDRGFGGRTERLDSDSGEGGPVTQETSKVDDHLINRCPGIGPSYRESPDRESEVAQDFSRDRTGNRSRRRRKANPHIPLAKSPRESRQEDRYRAEHCGLHVPEQADGEQPDA